MRIDFQDYLEWLQNQHPNTILGMIILRSEDTPLALWLKQHFGIKNAYLGDYHFLGTGQYVELPYWAIANELLSHKMLDRWHAVTVWKALRIADLAIREAIERQTRVCEEEVESGM